MFLLAKFVQLVAMFAIFGFSHQNPTFVSKNDLKCGITFYNDTISDHHRINHGDTAAEGQWPWMATLIIRDQHHGFCGATIISEEYILSAGHCLRGAEAEGVNFTENVQVAVGAVNPATGREIRVDIAATFLHPNYDKTGWYNDLLVLKLAKPLVLSDTVQPICLAGTFDGDNVTKPEDESAIVAGWGYKDHESTPTDTLLYGHMYFVDIETCAKSGIFPDIDINRDMHICAAGKKQNPEMGDSGGPIFIKSELKDIETERNRYVQVGICSFGSNPAVFARVSPYCEFVKKATNGSVNCVNL